jgi:hypothetical protein
MLFVDNCVFMVSTPLLYLVYTSSIHSQYTLHTLCIHSAYTRVGFFVVFNGGKFIFKFLYISVLDSYFCKFGTI